MTLDTDTKVQVINNLTSSSTTAALSANQGRLLNSSVSNGKTQVANAITDKGVAASGSDSFATLASKIRNISTLDPIYQDIIDNTVIESDCVGSEYHYDWRDAQLISGSRSFIINNDTYTLHTSSNDSGPSNGIVCWRDSSYGSPSDIYLYVDDTKYSHSSNRVSIYLRGDADDYDRVSFSINNQSYSDGYCTITFKSLSATSSSRSYTANYNGTIRMHVNVHNRINASIYGNIEQIAYWMDLNPSVSIYFR